MHSFVDVDFCLFICSWEETVAYPKRPGDDSDTARRLKLDLAFRMLSTGSRDMVPHALQLLPNSKVFYHLKKKFFDTPYWLFFL